MRRHSIAALLALAFAAAALADKPGLAVLAIESASDSGKLGRFVRTALMEKLGRTYQFSLLEAPDVDTAAKHAGFQPKPDTPAEKVAEFAEKALDCRFVIWGAAIRDKEGWVLAIQGIDLEESKTQAKWKFQEAVTGHREVPLACNRIAAEVSGFEKAAGKEPEVPEARRRPDPRPELLPNGDFEKGADSPDKWQRVDNLTTFWDTQSKTGRGLMVDTDVLETQALAWREQIAKGADFRKPPKKEPTKPPKYDTIGGTYGVHYISDPIPVKRGVIYRLSADVKALSSGIFFPKIFVKGYASYEATDFAAQDREMYRMYLACRSETEGREFERHTRTFLPNPFYVVYDIENAAGTAHAGQATDLLRRTLRQAEFPMIPDQEQNKRLAEAGAKVGFDTVLPEIVVVTRDRLRCAHAIYGKVAKDGEGLKLFLRLASARIKSNLPLLDLSYPLKDDAALQEACGQFVKACEKRLPFVQYMRVIPYSYWPPQQHRYDNLTLTEEGDALW